jgi:hypothetical protein
MHWALELAARPEMSAADAARIWQEVRRRADESPLTGDAVRRLRDGLVRGWRQLTASLVQETLIPSPAVRGPEAARPALLVYETDEFAISLSFSAPNEADRLRMVGQLVPKRAREIPAGGKVLVWSEHATSSGELNDHGEFALDELPRGDLHMDILLGGDSIQISPIQTRPNPIREE